jgi:hypothetical protein
MNPVAPIVSLPRPESDRILFDRIVVGTEYYIEYREYIGPGWGQRTMLLLAKVHPDTTSSMVVGWPVWGSWGGSPWVRRVTDFSANRAQIDTDNGGREYYHFYRTPQGPVGDPTAVALAPPVGAAAPAAAVGNNAAGDPVAVPVAVPAAPVAPPVGAAAPAAAVGNNAAGDPVAPRRLPSRKRKRSRRTNRSRRTPRFNRGNE